MAYDAYKATEIQASSSSNSNYNANAHIDDNDDNDDNNHSSNVVNSFSTAIMKKALTAAQKAAIEYTLKRNNTSATTTTTTASASENATSMAATTTNELKWHNFSVLLTKDNANALITAIRANVTSILNAYFQQHAAATTTATNATTTTKTLTQLTANEFDDTPTNTTIISSNGTSAAAPSSPSSSTSSPAATTIRSNYANGVQQQQIISTAGGSITNDAATATAATTLTHLSMATTQTTTTTTTAAAATAATATAATMAANSSSGNATAIIANATSQAFNAVATALNGTNTINSNGIGIDNATDITTTTTAAAAPTLPSITFLRYPIAIQNSKNCSTIFADYVYQPSEASSLPSVASSLPFSSSSTAESVYASAANAVKGTFCNWTWDGYLCWPPTPAGALARMHCPSGILTVDARKYAARRCEYDGHWGGRPNETPRSETGWTDFQPCFDAETNKLLKQITDPHVFEIAMRTRTLEIVGLVLSLFALIISLTIFCNFRSLRNNRTKIHKNLFIAMILQVIMRLTLYLDQAIRRGSSEETNTNGIGNTPYLCEATIILFEYAKTAMFMWMWIEGFYLHNMVATLAVFHGGFPHTIFFLIGWFFPSLITCAWAICTAQYMNSKCWVNYNLTSYYWILEGPRSLVILLNFFFLINIIRVLVVKLRESQASDVEQTRKAVKAAIVLLPLLGITNLLHLSPIMTPPWKFALWSYVTYFLTSFQGFFIALIYCFLNGEVRAVLMKSIAVFMSVRGHTEWVPKQASMFSGAYNTAPDTEAPALGQQENRRNADVQSPPSSKHHHRRSGSIQHNTIKSSGKKVKKNCNNNNNSSNNSQSNHTNKNRLEQRNNCLLTLCFRGQKVLRPPATSDVPPESVVFELSEQ